MLYSSQKYFKSYLQSIIKNFNYLLRNYLFNLKLPQILNVDSTEKNQQELSHHLMQQLRIKKNSQYTPRFSESSNNMILVVFFSNCVIF